MQSRSAAAQKMSMLNFMPTRATSQPVIVVPTVAPNNTHRGLAQGEQAGIDEADGGHRHHARRLHGDHHQCAGGQNRAGGSGGGPGSIRSSASPAASLSRRSSAPCRAGKGRHRQPDRRAGATGSWRAPSPSGTRQGGRQQEVAVRHRAVLREAAVPITGRNPSRGCPAASGRYRPSAPAASARRWHRDAGSIR